MNQLNTCNLCGSENLAFVDIVHDYNRWYSWDFKLYKCKDCGLMFLNPQPDSEEIMEYYTSDYYQKIGEGSGIQKVLRNLIFFVQKIYVKNPKIFKMMFFFSPYVRGIKIIPNGKYLDVGCGNGAFLYTMQKINPSWEYQGIEPGEFDQEDMNKHNLNVIKWSLESIHYPDDYFDNITLNHVFEHVSDPSETIKELRRILKPGWILIIAVPNSNSLTYKLFGKYFRHIDAPRHLFHYSDKTLKKYAQKANLKYIKTRYGAFWDQTSFIASWSHYMSSIFWWNLWKKFNNGIGKKNIFIISIFILLYIILTPLTLLLNLIRYGDSIEVWMRK